MKGMIIGLGIALGVNVAQAADTLTTQWSRNGFDQPESALVAPSAEVIYISNINGNPNEKNGRGYISRLAMNGEPLNTEWVSGLNAPKGMGLDGNRLYVADIDRVIVIDTDQGKIVREIAVEGAQFLNDITVDGDGRVYISDMLGNAIYRIENAELTLWLKDEKLDHPNGLVVHNGALIVGSWGSPMAADFSTGVPGSLLNIDLKSRRISSLNGGERLGNLDGLVRVSDGYVISDWMAGTLLKLNDTGETTVLGQLTPGLADIGGDEQQLVLPLMNTGEVTMLQLGDH